LIVGSDGAVGTESAGKMNGVPVNRHLSVQTGTRYNHLKLVRRMKMRAPDGIRVLFDERCAGVETIDLLLEVPRGPRSKVVWQKVTRPWLHGIGVGPNKYHSRSSFAGKDAFRIPYFAEASING
jgi:hypothetical protein